MEKPPPSWLDTAYFERALKSNEDDTNFTVTSCDVQKALAAGDNYGSDIYRASLKIERNGKPEEKSVIVKCSLSVDGYLGKTLKESNVFVREIQVFTIVFPEMERLLKKAYVQDFQPIPPKYIYSNVDELVSTIALDDLKVQGFKLPDRRFGLDKKHCLLVMNRIAKYHATSVYIKNENPELLKPFEENSQGDENWKAFESFFTKTPENAPWEVETWSDYKDRFAEKLHGLSSIAMKEWTDALKRKDSEFNVLIHGDFKANNVMFRYSEDTGDVEDVRFVDFQLSWWTSPAVDLHYFIQSSASLELVESPQILLQEYYNTLSETLNLLGRPHLKPSFLEIQEQMERRSNYAMLTGFIIRPLSLPSYKANTMTVPEDKPIDVFKQSLRKLLSIYDNNGWI